MQASDIPGKFSKLWAVDATTGFITAAIPITATGPAASQSLGFPPLTATPTGAGGTPPNIADFNGFGKYTTAWNRWQQAGAPIGYDAAFSAAYGGYPKGAQIACAGCLGATWLSTADNNVTNPDAGGAGWVLRSPFPIDSGVLSVNTTLTLAYAGQFISVTGASTTQTLPSASAVNGMAIGFSAVTPCTIASAGGNFSGAPFSGSSIALGAGDWLCVQSDGSLWRVFSASVIALQFPSGPGWTQNPNGSITQGGVGVAGSSGTFIAYPTPFKSVCSGLSLTVTGNPGYNGVTVEVDGLSNLTGFNAYGGNPTTGPGASVSFSYVATGF